MKVNKFVFGVFGLLALASCSSDEVINLNRDGDEITYSVVTNSISRANDIYCNSNPHKEFHVYASHNSKTYIEDDLIKLDNGKWVNQNGTRYWPKEGDVTFFAYHNVADDNFNWVFDAPSSTPTVNFTVENTVADQKDFIYAKQTQAKTAEGKVTLNFRHALSQIVFQAKNTNKNLYVEISGVSVCKVKNAGTFTYPAGDTNGNIEGHDGKGTYSGNWGSWGTGTLSGSQDYSVEFTAVPLDGTTSEIKALTTTPDTDKEYSKNAMLLLPQVSTAWDVNGTGATGKPADQNGTYFLVKCQIYNVAGTTVDKNKDVCLWGKDEPKDVAIPVNLNWEQGKKYIYTFVFGDGNGGYDPDQPDPTPVLVPVSFDVTVDDFILAGDDEEVKMDKPTA